MDREGGQRSSRTSSVIEKIRDESGIPHIIIDFMVFASQKNEVSAEDFYLQMKEVIMSTAEDYVMWTFNQIRENLPTRIEVDNTVTEFFWGRLQQSGREISPAMRRQQEAWVESNVRDYCFGAIDENLKPTELGKRMAELGLKPVLSKFLMAGAELGCGHEVLSIVAMLTVDLNFFCSPKNKDRRVAAQKRAEFFHDGGDLLTLLSIYEAAEEHRFSSKWCSDNFVSFSYIQMAIQNRDAIAKTMERNMNLPIDGGDQNNPMIRKSITAGLFSQSAVWDPLSKSYRTLVKNRPVHINADGALFHKPKPSFVVYTDIVPGRNKDYILGVTAIDPNWLLELAPQFYRRAST